MFIFYLFRILRCPCASGLSPPADGLGFNEPAVGAVWGGGWFVYAGPLWGALCGAVCGPVEASGWVCARSCMWRRSEARKDGLPKRLRAALLCEGNTTRNSKSDTTYIHGELLPSHGHTQGVRHTCGRWGCSVIHSCAAAVSASARAAGSSARVEERKDTKPASSHRSADPRLDEPTLQDSHTHVQVRHS